MPIVQFSAQDLLSTKILIPGWYVVRIDSVGEKPSSGDNPSTTKLFPISGTVIRNAENGSEEFAGCPTPYGWSFNDNPGAAGIMIGFLMALGYKPEKDQRIDLKAAEGKELEIFIENGTWEGRVVNRIGTKFRPLRGAA